MEPKKIMIELVDSNSNVIGLKEKFETHHNPVPLHRAISVIVFDPKHEKLLLQKRPDDKPTWGGFWSNTCCTHPYPEESYEEAAKRRLQEEMGFTTQLQEKMRFLYDAKMDETWGEHEYDVVFVGEYEGDVNPDPNEVADWKWMTIDELNEDMTNNHETYSPWFKVILKEMGITEIEDKNLLVELYSLI